MEYIALSVPLIRPRNMLQLNILPPYVAGSMVGHMTRDVSITSIFLRVHYDIPGYQAALSVCVCVCVCVCECVCACDIISFHFCVIPTWVRVCLRLLPSYARMWLNRFSWLTTNQMS